MIHCRILFVLLVCLGWTLSAQSQELAWTLKSAQLNELFKASKPALYSDFENLPFYGANLYRSGSGICKESADGNHYLRLFTLSIAGEPASRYATRASPRFWVHDVPAYRQPDGKGGVLYEDDFQDSTYAPFRQIISSMGNYVNGTIDLLHHLKKFPERASVPPLSATLEQVYGAFGQKDNGIAIIGHPRYTNGLAVNYVISMADSGDAFEIQRQEVRFSKAAFLLVKITNLTVPGPDFKKMKLNEAMRRLEAASSYWICSWVKRSDVTLPKLHVP